MYVIEKEQSDRIQIVKIVSTFMVVFIHVNIDALAQKNGLALIVPHWLELFKFIISSCFSQVAVPFFFLFSGIFLYSKEFTWKNNVNKKARTLLIPYLFSISVYILMFLVAQNMPIMSTYFSNPDNVISKWGILKWIDAYVGKIWSDKPFNVPMWFIRDLIFLNIFSVLILKITNKVPIIILGLISLAWFSRWNLSVIDVQALFFIAGLFIVKYNIKIEVLDKIPWVPLLLISVIFLYLDCKYKLVIIHQVSIIIYMISMLKVSKYIASSRFSNNILKLSKYIFFIYAFHLIILTTMIKVLMRFIPQYSVIQMMEFCITPFLTVGICIWGANILIKISPRLYGLITGGR